LGRASDRLGRKPILVLGWMSCIGCFVVLYTYTISQDEKIVFFIIAGFFGIGDAVFNTQIYAMLGIMYESNSEVAFACFKLLQGGSSAAAFLYDDMLNFKIFVLICLSLVLPSIPLIYYLNRYVPRIGRPFPGLRFVSIACKVFFSK